MGLLGYTWPHTSAQRQSDVFGRASGTCPSWPQSWNSMAVHETCVAIQKACLMHAGNAATSPAGPSRQTSVAQAKDNWSMAMHRDAPAVPLPCIARATCSALHLHSVQDTFDQGPHLSPHRRVPLGSMAQRPARKHVTCGTCHSAQTSCCAGGVWWGGRGCRGGVPSRPVPACRVWSAVIHK